MVIEEIFITRNESTSRVDDPQGKQGQWNKIVNKLITVEREREREGTWECASVVFLPLYVFENRPK